MNILVVYYSESGNTEKVAHTIAESVGAELKRVQDVTPADFARCGLVFFGTPVQGSRPAPAVTRLLNQLVPATGKKAAAFGTMHLWGDKQALRTVKRTLEKKGYSYLGGFACRGLSRLVANIGPRLFNRGRPSTRDLALAADFARRVVTEAVQP
jgi:flavodoxin